LTWWRSSSKRLADTLQAGSGGFFVSRHRPFIVPDRHGKFRGDFWPSTWAVETASRTHYSEAGGLISTRKSWEGMTDRGEHGGKGHIPILTRSTPTQRARVQSARRRDWKRRVADRLQTWTCPFSVYSVRFVHSG
jgi:hypothetical protein